MKAKLPQWVSGYKDRHGKPRYRFRRKGFAPYAFRSTPDQPAFYDEYKDCLAGLSAAAIAPGVSRAAAGSFDDLISRYYRSPAFLDVGDRTRVVYRNAIEHWRETKGADGARYGSGMVRDLQPRHVSKMLADKASTPTSANMLRKRLRTLMRFAISEGFRPDDPTLSSRPYKVRSKGIHTWEEQEIAQYEARHPIGTKARLAFDLMLWTGQRPSDARRMGRQHIRDGFLYVNQLKRQGEVELYLPVPSQLVESIVATPSGHLTFIVTEFGKPFSAAGFGNKMRQWCDEAGLKQCSGHGLRKAAARRLAEAGCSNQQIKAWTGHTTDFEVSRYTKAVDQRAMAEAAAAKLRHSMANLAAGLDNPAAKTPKKAD